MDTLGSVRRIRPSHGAFLSGLLLVLFSGPETGRAGEAGQAGGKAEKRGKYVVEGSIFYPTYIAEGTVYTRGVSNMPLAANSADIAKYMPILPAKHNSPKISTFLNVTAGVPIYIVDSRDPRTPRATVQCPSFRKPSATLRKMIFSNDIPLPAYAQPSASSDSHLFVYDLGTDLMREYFLMKKNPDATWTASWGGYSEHMLTLAKDNFACQLAEGSAFVVGIIGGPGLIGIEEARRGEIRHAVGFLAANALEKVTSWPARGNDGTDTDLNAPAQGQWFRLPPSLNIEAMKLRPMTKLVARAAQKYGGFATDKTLGCHIFGGESGFVEKNRTGIDPWAKGGDLYKKYMFSNGYDLSDFPWHLTEWAPVDWGKPQ